MITRQWLKTHGASTYLARRLTQSLTVAEHRGQAYAYTAEAVLASVKAYEVNPKIRAHTKEILHSIVDALQEQLISETVPTVTSDTDDPLAAAMAKVSQANDQFEATAKKARQLSSDFQDYRSQRGQDFKSRNNVVTFA